MAAIWKISGICSNRSFSYPLNLIRETIDAIGKPFVAARASVLLSRLHAELQAPEYCPRLRDVLCGGVRKLDDLSARAHKADNRGERRRNIGPSA